MSFAVKRGFIVKAAIPLVLVAVALFANLSHWEQNHSIRFLLSNDEGAMIKPKPKIHTFYEPLANSNIDVVKEQMEFWKVAWTHAGFEPVILTLDDAKVHSWYPKFHQTFLQSPFKINKYNQLCFYRWLAMASSGGGWMADMDVFPLDVKPGMDASLPNDGNFTALQGHVPGLVAGSESEWNRIIPFVWQSLMENNKQFWSDMLALKDMVKSGVVINGVRSARVLDISQFYVQERIQLGKNKRYDFDPFLLTEKKCKKAKNVDVVHFSHYGTNSIHLDQTMVEKWLTAFHYSCDPSRKTVVQDKPKMNTFYQPLSNSNQEKYEVLVDQWKQAWSHAGFEPVVLTLNDAKGHPYYKKFEGAFATGRFNISTYDTFCFYRWLAMASSGGGWMSDLDTFPLDNKPVMDLALPNDGKLTGHRSHVPCLMSGTQEEWNRIIQPLFESYRRKSMRFWSDMFAMLEMIGHNRIIAEDTKVINIKEFYGSKTDEIDIYRLKNRCHFGKGRVAVHFSHGGVAKVGATQNDMADKWLSSWYEQCGFSRSIAFLSSKNGEVYASTS